VLRFWETKFPQIKPLKRNGGRRFYRPQDLEILQQIKHLLYSQGYTIKGAKKAVDEFIHARATQGVSSQQWLEEVPPASVNDNHDYSAETPDMLAELAQALREPEPVVEKVADTSREALVELRAQLMQARSRLEPFLQASPASN
jgi:DNA-binding transcriptional MerR regulator